MKKILILISLLMLTGCYDYKEINDLALISAIGVDYYDNKYVTTLEVLNDEQEKDSAKLTSYLKIGTGDTLTSAIEDAADKLPKQVSLNHVKLMILSKSIIEDNFENIMDFFLRNTYFRENFYVVSSIDNKPEEILSTKTENAPIASIAITSILENMDYSSNSNILKKFNEINEEIITYGIDTCFSNILLDNKDFLVDGMVIFSNYDYKAKLSSEDVKIYNILRNNFDRPSFSKKYDSLYFTVAINNGNTKLDINKGTINITGNLMGRILDNQVNFNLKDINNLLKLDKDFSILLNNYFINFIKTLQENNSDILGITKYYYKKTRIKNDNYWKYLDIDSNVFYYINKKGLIYEVDYEHEKK